MHIVSGFSSKMEHQTFYDLIRFGHPVTETEAPAFHQFTSQLKSQVLFLNQTSNHFISHWHISTNRSHILCIWSIVPYNSKFIVWSRSNNPFISHQISNVNGPSLSVQVKECFTVQGGYHLNNNYVMIHKYGTENKNHNTVTVTWF